METRPPFRIEDLLLAGWNAVGVPLLVAAGPMGVVQLGGDGPPDRLAGVVQLLAVVGAIVAIATRPPAADEEGRFAAALGEARLAFIGPMVAAVAFVAGSAASHLGLAIDNALTGIAFLAVLAAAVFGNYLPVIDAGLRRALIAPFTFVAAGMFNGFAAALLTDVNLPALVGDSLAEGGAFALFILIMLVGGLAFFYAALVAAPRMVIDAESTWLAWPLRFVLFLVSSAVGIGWLTLLAF
jgi:hypothetical protein